MGLLVLIGFLVCPVHAESVADLAALKEAADTAQSHNRSLQLEGTVLWSGKSEGRIILRDDTAILLLDLQVSCRLPELGDRLRLEGECSVMKARDAIVLSSVAVVENNGLHAFTEKSGEIVLEAGRHPIQVAWFNRTDRFGLEVEYEGPGISRQHIPPAELYRAEVDSATGITNVINGLDYRCFEGQWWRLLPNFDHLPASASGVIDHFDVGVRTRDSHVGLQFSGFINIPRDGHYTFHVRSDDGSRLFVGPSSFQMVALGRGTLPALPAAAASDEVEFQWSEIEGSVAAVHRGSGRVEVELMTKAGLVLVKVAESPTDLSVLELHNRMRIAGVSRRVLNTAGNWVPGEFYVQRLEVSGRQDELQQGGDRLPQLTTIDQIYRLGLEESSRRYPVQVRGVITSLMEANGAVLQDSSRGIYVALSGPIHLQVGDYCEIEGTTGPYRFSPYIEASQVEVLGAGSLPKPVEPSWDQLINGSLHCNYVELEGVVASSQSDRITLLTRGGRIHIRLNPASTGMPSDALGATVRLRGCLRADWDGISRRVMVGSIYLDQRWITVVEPAPDDPFRVRYKRVDDLLQFDPEAGALQHVRVYGVLVHKGREVSCVMDGDSGLRFMPTKAIDAGIGDMVDVAGFLELDGATPVLREAIARSTSHAGMPEPVSLSPDDLLSDRHDATYVKVEGILLGVTEHEDSSTLELQNGLRRFVAELEDSFDTAALVPGSRLELAGTYIGLGGNRVLGRPINSFKLLLNSSADITELSRPPWWTLRRMLNVVGLLAVVLAAALVWIKLLRRTVEQRTTELGNQIRERQRAEHQRKIEQERARLANDLHDDLGARITEVNMLASLVRSSETSDAERARYTGELSDIALHMVTSLDEIVWAVNPRNDTVSSLADYFGAYAQRFLELAGINCGLDMADCRLDSPLDTRLRRQIFLAFKEALSNVVRHADAGKVWLRIVIEGDDLVVVVSDDGHGFDPEADKAGSDGLINMKKRLKRLGGTCTVESETGKGTTVRLQAPIQKGPE